MASQQGESVLKNEDLPALFWDELPDNPDNPDVAAIKAIMDESTPEERAESFKVCDVGVVTLTCPVRRVQILLGSRATLPVPPSLQDQGNDALKVGLQQKKKFYLRQAIEQYTEGLNLMCSDAKLNAVLYSNRAHVNLLLGNYRNALEDAKAALKNNPAFVKVWMVSNWLIEGVQGSCAYFVLVGLPRRCNISAICVEYNNIVSP